jgi:phosphoribosylglycinamide formyltransferase 2
MSEPTGPRVMLLGSGEPGRELTTALRHLGAEVTAVNDDVADADPPGVSAELARLEPDFVVTVTDSISSATLAAVEAIESILAGTDDEFTELVPSARSVRLTTDREGLRRLAAEDLGLPTAPFWFVGSVGELKDVAADAGFPLLLKPAAGQRQVVSGPGDIQLAWHLAVGQEGATPQRVLAETVVDIEFEVSLLAVRTDGPTGPVIEFCTPIGHRGAAGVLESWQPQELSPAATDAAKSVAARIVKALGGRGVFSVELMINGDEVYFADVTACPHPSAWVTLRSQRLSAFELQARAILGLPVDTMMISPGASRAIMRNPQIGPPIAVALAGALSVPESDVRLFGRGSQSPGAARKLGVALATAPQVGSARDRARQAATALHMRDSRG